MDRFVNLHVHDCFNSLLDAISRPEEIVNFAKENGQKAVAFTGHGSMASFILQAKYCRQAGVKPIFGCEVYEVDDMWKKESTKEHPEQRNHLILLAKNQDGFQNLLKIVSLAGTEGKYIKPRIDINEIQKNNWGDGIIALTACMAGRMSRYAEQNNIEEMSSWYDTLTETFDDAYVELQSHGVEEQRILNNKLIDFIKREDIKDHFVITSDAHMINDSDRDIHRMFVATGQSREVGETYKDCYMQTEKSMRNIMEQQIGKGAVNASILNMKHLVDQIEDIDVGLDNDTLMPIFEYPEEFDSSLDYLKYLIKEGLKEKHKTLGIDVKEYSKRVKTELDVIVELGYVDYFLIMYMLIHKAQKRGIPLGYGRGSAGGCLILYLIGVTQVDSIKWDLDFSRFANLGRKGSMADIDLDMSKRRRKEMINIAEDLFGKDKVCAVSTFNTMTMKVAIRDVGKVMDEQEDSIYKGQIPYSIRDKAAKLMPEILLEDDKGRKISKQEGFINAIKTNGELYDIYMEFPKWFEYALALDGLPKSRGKNASAIIISPKPITYYASLCQDSDGEPIFEPEMHALMDDIKLVKFDFLGLKTLDVVDDTLKFSHLTWEDVDINHLDLEDKDVFDNIFKNGNTVGIFQTESAEARNMCIQAKCDNVEDIVVVNSANRPGTKDQFPDYCKNKLNPDQIVVVHPDMKEIFKQSHSVMMYQEQALALLRYAGFDEKETDVGRRAIGKKKIDVMKTLEVKFKKGLKDKEWTDEQANETWDLMVKQSGYSFNRCLTGDTMLYRASSCGRDKAFPTPEITIEEVYKRFNSKTPVGKKYRSKTNTRGLFIMCRDEDGRARKQKVKNVYEQGVQDVWEIELENGKKVRATKNHKFQIADGGYKLVKDLIVGDCLWSCDFIYEKKYKKYNLTKLNEKQSLYTKGKHYEGCGFKTGCENPGFVDGGSAMFDKYMDLKNGVCECCGKEADRLETHHIDGDRTNNSFSNLENLCVSCHKKKHYREFGRTKRGDNGYSTYLSPIKSISYVGQEVTYDVEIDSKEHNFFANGICSHNSHAVAYSLLSYLTGYLKYHYQESFMAACLISAGDGEKVSQYISDMKTFGVELSPPDINLSGSTFTPDPEHHKIYYGINDINSIKSTTFDTINDLRPFKSYQDYINRTLDLIDKTSQIMLIKSGAFTNLTTANRTRQFKYLWQERFLAGKEQLKPIKKVNKTHIQKLLEGGIILSSEQNDKELCLEKFNRARKIDGWNEFENKYLEGNELNWEMDSLNTFISGDPFEGVVLPNWDNVVKDNIGHVGGVITSRKVNTVKKGKSKGQKMGFINLETKYGIIDIVVFADQWKKFGDLLTFGNTVVIGGLKTGDKKCTLNKAYSLNEYLIKTSKCQLKK